MDSPHIVYETLIAYAAGSLSVTESRLVANHAAFCGKCGKVVARYKFVRYLMVNDDSAYPPPTTIASARALFRQQRPVSAATPVWESIQALWRAPMLRQVSIALLIVALVVSNLVIYSGINHLIAASQTALPGDSLYPVKLTAENLQLALTWDNAGKVGRHLEFSGLRVDETAALVDVQRLAEIPATLAAFEKEVALISITYDALAKENAARAQSIGHDVQVALAGYSTRLADVRASVGDTLQPVVEKAISTSNTSRQAINASLQRLPAPAAPVAATPTLGRGAPPASATIQKVGQTPPPASPASSAPVSGQSSSNASAPAKPTAANSAPAVPTAANTVPAKPTLSSVASATPTATMPPSPIPPGQERKTITPTPNVPPGQEKKTVSPTPKQSDRSSSKSK